MGYPGTNPAPVPRIHLWSSKLTPVPQGWSSGLAVAGFISMERAGDECWIPRISRSSSCTSLSLLETLQMIHLILQSCGEQREMSLWGSVPFLQELWLLISLPQALLEVRDQRGLNQPSFPGQSHPTGSSCQGCSREADGNVLRFSELT